MRGDAARDYECTYTASFTDGTQTALVPAGAACESESLAPLESFQIVIRSRTQAAAPVAAEPAPKAAAPRPAAKAPAPKAAAKPDAKPAPRRR